MSKKFKFKNLTAHKMMVPFTKTRNRENETRNFE